MLFRRLSVLLAFVCLIPNVFSGEAKGIVNVGKLNVRVKPDTKYSAVSGVKRGDELTVLEEKDGWYRIKAPADTSVWVASAFLKDGMTIKEINLRSGPGVAYSPFGTIKAGAKVEVLDSSRENWVKISPPEDLCAWVSAKYIFLSDDEKRKLHGEGAVAAATPVQEKKKEEGTSLKQSKLPFINEAVKDAVFEGILLPLDDGAVYVTHAVVVKTPKGYQPLCYVYSGGKDLKSFENRQVWIKGEQKWVKGWKCPVVEVSKMSAVEDNTDKTQNNNRPKK